MEVELTTLPFPEDADVRIDISISAHIGITALSAQRKVSRLLLEQVGNLVYGESPSLVTGARLLWRVPVWVSSPSRGALGQVGTIDVDVQTGEIIYSPDLLKNITDQAIILAEHPTPNAA